MPKSKYKANTARYHSQHAFKEKTSYSKKPDTIESHPIFKFTPKLTGNSQYFYTGLWLMMMLTVAHGVDTTKWVDQVLENEKANGGMDAVCSQSGKITEQGSACSTKPLIFSQHARSSVHPGLYSLRNEITNHNDVLSKVLNNLKSDFDEDNPVHLEYAQLLGAEMLEQLRLNFELSDSPYTINPKRRGEIERTDPLIKETIQSVHNTFEIDQLYTESDPFDRTAHDRAIDYIEKLLLNKPLKNLHAKEWKEILGRLNYLMNNPKDKSSAEKQSALYRNKGMTVPKIHNFPGLMPKQAEKAYDYLEKYAPEDIPAFKEYVEWHGKIKNQISDSDPMAGEKILKQIFAKSSKARALFNKYLYIAPKPSLIASKMQSFFETLSKKLLDPTADIVATAAYAHMEIVRIHPYADANGRTARALMNSILVQNKLPSIAFLSNKAYTEAITACEHTGNDKPFEEYVKKEIEKAQDPKKASILHSFASKMQNCLESCKKLCMSKCQDELKKEAGKINSI